MIFRRASLTSSKSSAAASFASDASLKRNKTSKHFPKINFICQPKHLSLSILSLSSLRAALASSSAISANASDRTSPAHARTAMDSLDERSAALWKNKEHQTHNF